MQYRCEIVLIGEESGNEYICYTVAVNIDTAIQYAQDRVWADAGEQTKVTSSGLADHEPVAADWEYISPRDRTIVS